MPKMRTPLSCLLGVGGSATPFPGRVPIVRAMQGPIRSLDAVVQFTEPFFTGGRGPRVGVSAGRRGREPSRVLGAGRSCAHRDVHSALERCILHSRCAVRSARSSAKCTSRRPGGPGGPGPACAMPDLLNIIHPGSRGVLRARAGRVPTRLPDSGGAGPGGPGGCPAMEPYRSEPSLDTRIIMNSMNTQSPFAALTSQMRMYAPLRSGGLA